jgi:hypothetical protein
MIEISFDYYLNFDKTINKYLIFLVHVQQSEKISIKNKMSIFAIAKDISLDISNHTKKYFSNLNEYNMLEKKETLVNVFDNIINVIEKEIKTYDIIIDDSKLFSLNDIIDKLTTQNKDIYLTPMDVKNMFTYKEFDKNKKLDEKAKKKLDEINKKQDNELDEIKFKAFENLINKNNTENNNIGLFYRINKKILDDLNKDDIIYSEEKINENDLKPGLYFIKIHKELNIVEKGEGLLTKYCIKIIDRGDEFIIHIQGSIRIDEQEKMFKIYEKYANQKFGQIINSYKLKPLIELFNELFVEKYRNEKDVIKDDKIEDYLTGKIKR